MSEHRTQAPSKRRREEARAQGVVARSSELTAAVGLLAAVALIGAWGGSLASGCIDLVRQPFLFTPSDPNTVAALIRGTILHIAAPLIGMIGGVALAMIATHQAQVGGFWVSALVAPDPRRLWSSSGADWSARAGRGAWGVAKTALLASVAAWAIWREWGSLTSLLQHEVPTIAAVAGATLRRLLFTLGLATLVLGVIDYLLARAKVEAILCTTPEESREDAKAIDGDPAVRARRLSLAKAWRADPGEVLEGSVLVVTGPSGLAVVLGGERPPGKITVRASARGASGVILQRSAKKAGLAIVEAPELARHFASPAARTQALPEALSPALHEAWPRRSQGSIQSTIESPGTS
jgi:flagellar biosynthesis protein FlhB